ncbi:UDP-N-acetylmuramoyl-L-alanyl-D-glutamate--2,6-diaminopimelate ligase [Bacillota bacterium]
MRLENLLQKTGINCPDELKNTEINRIGYDSRKIQKGDAFVCLKGRNTDGHIFAGDAAFRGAAVIVSEHESNPVQKNTPVLLADNTRRALSHMAVNYYGNPGEGISLFGVTGTNGKTTVSYLIKSGLETDGEGCGLIGTISYKVGDKEYEAERTTPESLDIQKIFSELRAGGIKRCTIEVSSHALQLGRVQDLMFDYSVFTNLSQDHMDFHKDSEEYYQAKKKLFNQTAKMGIINIDDESGRRLAGELRQEGVRIRTFSMTDSSADYTGYVKEMDEKGSCLLFSFLGSEVAELESALIGQFSAYNILAAASCLHAAGVSPEGIIEGIEKVKNVPGRFEPIRNSRGITVFVDFAHTPDALKNVLITGGNLANGRVICVFGCGGDRDRSKRPYMGRMAGEYADYCIVTSDNPRTESQKQIFNDIEAGLYETGCYYEVIEDRKEAIRRAISIYKKGDIIIVAGKGHENYQIIGGAKSYFSDRETVKELIEKGDGDFNGKDKRD